VIVATWNINSVRVRAEQLCGLLLGKSGGTSAIDVVLLQEIKCVAEAFPREFFEDIGYNCLVFGQKSNNGVAILSKYRIEDERFGDSIFAGDQSARYVDALINGYRIASVYVPNGQSPESPQYQYKLRFLETLKDSLARSIQNEKLIIGGDFNITRDDSDVYDAKLWNDKRICCTKPERDMLAEIIEIGLADKHRELSGDAAIYTWWDYRSAGFAKNNGLRLDYMLTTHDVDVRACYVDLGTRALERPSDHAPVVVDIA
jgi:exodeoxyribonuclease-3